VLTEAWDGSSWTEVSDMATGRGNLGSAGPSTAAITAGGYDLQPAPFNNETEVFVAADFQIKSVTTS
jgi:hypothetical protein